MTENEIWKSINDTRFDRCKRNPEVESELEGMSWNVEKLSHLLGRKNASYEVNEEFTKNKTNSKYSLFLDLFETPSGYGLDYIRLYSKTIYGGPPSRLLLLALNILKKSNNNFKQKAKHIFSEISSVLKIYHNISFENKKDLFLAKGEIY